MNGTGETVSIRKLASDLAVMIAIGLLLALLGPFGTFALPLARRLFVWLAFAIGGYLFFRPIVAAGSALAAQTRLPRLIAIGLACAVASLPTTLLVAWMLAGSDFGAITLASLAGLYPQVLLVGVLATIVQLAAEQYRKPGKPAFAPDVEPVARPTDPEPHEPHPHDAEPSAVEPPRTEPPAPSFLDQLPATIGRDLLTLENEDHYVRATTPLGNALILARMRDAVAGLAGIDGLRVHRSWWVARAAVDGVARRDRTLALRLTDGREVPVARSMAAALRDAGWLD